MRFLFSLLAMTIAGATVASADIVGKTFNTGAGGEVESLTNTLDIHFEPCESNSERICGRVANIVLPDGTYLTEPSIMPDGTVLQNMYLITDLEAKGGGKYRGGRVFVVDESIRDEKMKYYGFIVDENDDNTITVAGCIGIICPRKLVWTVVN